jgi:hypothetical protein
MARRSQGLERIRKFAAGSALGLVGLLGAAARTVRAATTPLSIAVTRAGVQWSSIDNDFGTHSFDAATILGCTTPTHCPTDTSGSPFGIGDASLTGPGCSDAFDTMLGMTVDGAAFVAPGGIVDLTGNTVTAGPLLLSGLSTEVRYEFFSSQPVVRALFSFHNPTGSTIDATVIIGGEYGSDDSATVEATEDGDTTIEPIDGWYVTSDENDDDDCSLAGADPTITVARFDTAAPLLPTTANVPGSGANDYFREEFDISVPAGETVRIAFFVEVNQFISTAVAEGSKYDDSSQVALADLWSNLSPAELSEISNWVTSTPELVSEVPTLSLPAKVGLAALLALLGTLSIRRLGAT